MDFSLILVVVVGGLIGLALGLSVPYFFQGYVRLKENQLQRVESALGDMLLPIPKSKLNLLYIGSIFGSVAVIYLLTHNFLLSLGGLFIGALIPMAIIRMMEENRRKKFVDQLIDTLNLLSSSLKAGLTLPQAFEVVVEEMPSPTREEFALILQQMKMGIPLEEALSRLRERIRNDDVDLVVISVLVARDTGGNVTEVFSNLARMIREKKKMVERVKVLTIQARWQGLLISAMPFIFVPFVIKQDPHHFDMFFKDPVGQKLLVYAVISEVIGLVLLRMLGKIDI